MTGERQDSPHVDGIGLSPSAMDVDMNVIDTTCSPVRCLSVVSSQQRALFRLVAKGSNDRNRTNLLVFATATPLYWTGRISNG